MFGRLAAAQFNQQSLAHIEPQFDNTASPCEAAAEAASPDRPKNKSAVDSVVLSLIPFAIVACVVVGGIFGAGFVMIGASEENIVAQTVRKPEATLTSRREMALPSEVTATPPPSPTPSLREPTPSLLPEQTHRLDKATLVTPPGQIFSPREAPTIPTEQTASAEVVVHDSSASPASNSVSEELPTKAARGAHTVSAGASREEWAAVDEATLVHGGDEKVRAAKGLLGPRAAADFGRTLIRAAISRMARVSESKHP